MKRNLFMLAAAGCFALTSCSSDDDNDNNNNGNQNLSTELTGTYQLSSVTAPTSQDYDGDGDSSSNLTLEGSCYSSSWISFHSDGTYEEESNSSTTGQSGLSLDCDSKISSGTYTKNGNTINTTRTSGDGEASGSFNFDSNSRSLTRTDNNGSYTGLNSATSLWATLTGTLKLKYTKYTDNADDNGAGITTVDNNNNSAINADLLGNFNLTSYLVGTAQDLNNDGTTSSNLMNETSCYNSSKIVFKNDGTYDETSSNSTLGNLGLSLNCSTETVTHGRWKRDGNNITTTRNEGTGHVDTQYTFNSSSHTVTRTNSNGQYPSFNVIGSLFTMASGNVTSTFTRSGSASN